MVLVERMNVQLRIKEEELGKYLQEGFKEVKKKQFKQEDKQENKYTKTKK